MAERSKGMPSLVLSNILSELETAQPDLEFADRVVVTGSGRALVPLAYGVVRRSEILAHARAAVDLAPQARSVVEIGGQDSKFILLDPDATIAPVRDYAFNDLCAAGTGAFLDQQAARLSLSIQELSEKAAKASRPAAVAGRCAVFAKTDMIHLQQKGVPQDEILCGLCYALARNYITTLLKGRKIEPPVLFLGGVAKNRGVVRAFVDLLGLSMDQILLVDEAKIAGALGAALIASSMDDGARVSLSALHPRGNIEEPEGERAKLVLPPRPVGIKVAVDDIKTAFLGIDVGSVSTCMALADEYGNPLATSYVRTNGRPLNALKNGLKKIFEQVQGREPEIQYVGTTGSGRQLAASVVGGDVIKDEITAQATAAVHLDPMVDTIVEIGGQDAKLILLDHGVVKDFALNRVCAAGTGSFLEEQAARLSIRVEDEFSKAASAGKKPVMLGNRCTVFMDADLIHHQQRGKSKEDLIAGLAYAVVENYIEKVAQGRRLGKRIMFLGGVAANRAVVAAFSNLQGKTVTVPSEHKVSGALGAALLAAEEWKSRDRPQTRFRGFSVSGLDVKTRTFECHGCENLCEVSSVIVGNEKPKYFGGACERYERGVDGPTPGAGLFMARNELFLNGVECLDRNGKAGDRDLSRTIGIPRALQVFDLLVFFRSLVKRIGYKPILSRQSSKSLLHKGLPMVTAEACFPVKLLFGHVRELLDAGVEKILLPTLLEVPSGPVRAGGLIQEPMRVPKDFPCLYTQSSPDLIRAGLDHDEDKILSPRMALNPRSPEWRTGLRELAQSLDVKESEVLVAADRALDDYRKFRASVAALGNEALQNKEELPVVVIIGRPYNIHDELLNLSIARKLKKLGALAVPMDLLALDKERLGPQWDSLYWRTGRDIIRATKIIRRNPDWLVIMLTGFGCGPDAFIQKYVENELEENPLLILEVDEHTADAGLLTRLEAFMESSAKLRQVPVGSAPIRPTPFGRQSVKGRKILVPDVNPCMRAYVAAFRSAGFDSDLLPATDLDSLKLGMLHSSGRECNPYSFILGDLIKLCNRSDMEPSKTAFFVPATDGPCLLPQYAPGYQLVAKKLGLHDLLLYSPNFAEFSELVGLKSVIRFWEGLVSIDLLQKIFSFREPGEARNGEARAALEEGLLIVDRAFDGSAAMDDALRDAVSLLVEATPNELPDGPVIGVVGDVFTRAVPAANANLVSKLQERGCTVLTPPALLDIGWYMVEENVWLARLRGEILGALIAKLKGTLQTLLGSRLEALSRDVAPIRREPGFNHTRALLGNRLCFRMDTPLSLNVAKALDFIDQGCDGVINAICHGCMVGLVSEAVFTKIEREQDAPPIVTLTFDGLQETNTETRLDALVELARARAVKRRAREGKRSLAGWLERVIG